MGKNINNIGVIGCGSIGSQLVLHFASFNKNIIAVEPANNSIETAKKMHNDVLNSRIDSGKITSEIKEDILSSIQYVDDITKLPANIELVIEAAPEDLSLKQQVFSQLEQTCSPDTIITTNSSSIAISKIEKIMNNKRNLLNTHFYPPIWERPVVELMRGSETSNETLTTVISLVKQTDLVPLLARKESMGFIFNRIWRAIKKEALQVANEGVATFEDIDRAWMLLLNYPIGPFGLMDMVGLDVIKDVIMSYHSESGKDKDLPPEILLNKIKNGELGRKTGKGFYCYPNPAFTNPNWLKNSDIDM